MKKRFMFVLMAAACAAFTVLEADAAAAKAPRQGMRYKTGGTIQRPVPADAKAVVFLNATGAESAVLDAYAKRFDGLTGSLYVKRVAGCMDAPGANPGDVVIALVAKGDMAILPLKRMAIVPVEADETATLKNLWKATVAVFSLMGEPPNDFTGAALIRSAAESLGIPHANRVFYKKALEEGWAPPPQDEFQRAVWERFKADKERGPAKPLTIPPPAKK